MKVWQVIAITMATLGTPVVASTPDEATAARRQAAVSPYDTIRAAVPASDSPLAIGRRAALEDPRQTARDAGIASTRQPAPDTKPAAMPPSPR